MSELLLPVEGHAVKSHRSQGKNNYVCGIMVERCTPKVSATPVALFMMDVMALMGMA